ncbi:sigma-70 family RNA polymerase sigma factor [Altererythrobacter sp. H2]|uniref:sigma-70 family RNA polymerase sigma factor n=1 Tax=Altererythrobacter sp. H2 TaxID=3108391 RepID=UPI002B4C16F6|nr:sigma-70 family RNA polymerase sigma factor [Altererythrobacter sp. H2]WRK96711.1 sigma-70 family RNA polymerase sigma factor [Altererythrobacter sp. H2]
MKADEASLARLMAMSQGGNKQAYATLLTECQRWLRAYYSRRIAPSQLDDLVQDTLMALHHKLATWDSSRPFLPWLAAIARYRWVDHLRRIYRADECELDGEFAGQDDEPAIAARISLDWLLGLLPDAQARAIELVKIEGLSVAEASQASGQSESLVKVNIHRGLKKLAHLIEKA